MGNSDILVVLSVSNFSMTVLDKYSVKDHTDLLTSYCLSTSIITCNSNSLF
jgi:hypothetical protein